MSDVKPKPSSTNHLLVNFEQLVEALRNHLEDSISNVWAHKSSSKHCKELTHNAQLLVDHILPIGQYAESALASETDGSIADFYIIYEWSNMAKSYMLLWRNILLESSKAHIQLKEQAIEDSVFDNLRIASKEVVQAAATKLEQALLFDKSMISPDQIEEWKLEQSPWEVYEFQFNTIVDQCNNILVQLQELSKVADQYDNINLHFNSIFNDFEQHVETLKIAIKDVCVEVLAPDNYDGTAVVTQLKNIKLDPIETPTLPDFVSKSDQYIGLLPTDLMVAIDGNGGRLLHKQLNLQKVTRSWVDTELMSSMHDCYIIQNNMNNQFELAKLNIRNSVEIEKQEGQSAEEKIRAISDNLLKLLTKALDKTKKLHEHIANLLEQLNVVHIFKDDFLTPSLGATFQQYQRYQIKGWNRIQNWIQQKGLFVENIKKSVLKEETLSLSEKIVRTVRQRTPSPENTHYTNMFLTQGYIGDSFHVGRMEELSKVKTTVDNWKLGFRGSLLITGKRLSGKTAMGALIKKQHFPQTTIQLKPNTKIRINGRFFDTTFQLQEALNFIVKHSLQTRLLIWIDDLSCWQSDKTSLGVNVRALLQIIDQFSNRLFFMISLSNILKDRLHQFYQLGNVFQSHINTDQMGIEPIKEALLVRHNATQMTLVEKDRIALTNTQLDKIIQKIYKVSKGNIGEALQYWAFTINKVDEEYVTPSVETYYKLPFFINTDLGLLLRTILLDKQTNEYILNKKFGNTFKIEYKPLLLRLFHLGVLERYANGFFGINPFLVNDIGTMLEQQIGLTFEQKKSQKTIKRI